MKPVWWWMQELWWGLTYKDIDYQSRRQRWGLALRNARCAAGLHYPVRFTMSYHYGGYKPPEPTWACDFCGVERLPYRAWLWSVPWIGRWVP